MGTPSDPVEERGLLLWFRSSVLVATVSVSVVDVSPLTSDRTVGLGTGVGLVTP